MFGSDIEFIQIVRLTICASIEATLLYGFGVIGCGSQRSLKEYLFSFLFFFVAMFPALILPADIRPFIQPPLIFLAFVLYLFIILHQRGFLLLKNSFLIIFFALLADTLSGLILMPLLSPNEYQALNQYKDPAVYLTNTTLSILTLIIIWVYSQFRHRSQKGHLLERISLVLRPVAMIACLLTLFIQIMTKSKGMDFNSILKYNSIELPVLLVLLFIGGSYANQDIKYLRQARMNSTLLQNQEIQEALLKDTRIFRHNVANMIYGFQGALMSGDRTAYEAYYADLVERCSIINNENVTNLQRIPSEALKTLLLNKITAANEKNIPFYLYVDRDLVFRSIRESDMCQVLGILLDNALESTQSSSAPLITLEMHNAGNEMEIAVRNTYDDDKGLPGQDDITFLTASTKDGHQGLGLKAVDDILKGHAVCNLYIQGRYVEANLLL